MSKNLFAILLSLLSLPSSAQINQNLQVVSYKLDNGFTVFLNKDTTATRVYGTVIVNAGAKHEDPSATGMAHYLEHMLFKGTERMGTWNYDTEKPHLDAITSLYEQLAKATTVDQKKDLQNKINTEAVAASEYALPNEFDKLLRSIGSIGINASTNYDITQYYNSFPAQELEKWLDLYSERFEKPVFRSFQSELEVVYEEKNRGADNMERRVFESMAKLTFANLPYGQWSVLGHTEHLKTPSLTRMYAFYDKYYVPGNMSLVLSGNFDVEKAKIIVDQKFGDWVPKPVAKDQFPELERIKGEKIEKARITPVKAAFLGYQTVSQTHPDRWALDVAEYLLYNSSETGYIDQMQLNNEMIYTGAFSSVYNDVGNFVVFYVPKVTKSLGNAERRIESVFDKLKNGEFSDDMFVAAKNDLGRAFQQRLESVESRGALIGEAFNLGISWEEILTYPEKIGAVTREDVIHVSKKYFGDNRAKMVSRTGFPKKDKLEKPPYKPVITKQAKSSTYADTFNKIPEVAFAPRFIDFSKDISRTSTDNGHQFYTVYNPINDLFSLEIRFTTGLIEDPKLEYAAQIVNLSGAGDLTLNQLKQAYASNGCTYRVSADANHLILTIRGREENLEKVLKLTNTLLKENKPDDKAKSVMENEVGATRKFEKRTPGNLASAMLNYASYGKNSPFLRRLSKSDIKKLTPAELKSIFSNVVTNYRADIVFSGKTSAATLKSLTQSLLPGKSDLKSTPFQLRHLQEVNESKIIFINDKKSVQSHIYYYMDDGPLGPEEFVAKETFNQYFGGGFSGIVMQEIREYRSLAYSTGASYNVPPLAGEKSRFITYIGCQADKTVGAVKVMNELLVRIPSMEERLPALRKNMQMQVNTNYPSFRDLPNKILELERMGYNDDPNKKAFSNYATVEMRDINDFFTRRIAGKPYIITIYGDKKRVNLDELKKLGKVEVLEVGDVATF